MNKSFTKEELDRALGACTDKSSPGLDGIEYKMLKGKRFRSELLERLNYAFESGKMFSERMEENKNHFY